MQSNFIIVADIETSGTDSKEHDIIELSAAVVDVSLNYSIAETFHRRVLFSMHRAHPSALEKNHYNSHAWRDAVSPRALAEDFSEFVEPYRYEFISRKGNTTKAGLGCGHSFDFDFDFIQALYSRESIWCPLGFNYIDTRRMAPVVELIGNISFPNYQLATIAETFGIDVGVSHTAQDDVNTTVEVLRRMMSILGADIEL